MARRNRFHFVVTRNRKFLANGTLDVGAVETHVSVNVDEDHQSREAAFVVLLVGAHNIALRDDHRDVLARMLQEYGISEPSPITSKLITPTEALDELADDLPF
jgi:hypothetical protein